MSRADQTRKEIESLKHIQILPGEYVHVSEPIRYIVVLVDEDTQTAIVRTAKSGFERLRTLYWCRKHLRKEANG
jgi:hypothetical protein